MWYGTCEKCEFIIKLTHFGNSCVLIISSSKKEVTGDTAVFEDGAMGKTPDGSVYM